MNMQGEKVLELIKGGNIKQRQGYTAQTAYDRGDLVAINNNWRVHYSTFEMVHG